MKKYISLIPWIFVLLWSTGFITAKLALLYSEPFFLITLRGVFTAAILLCVALIMKVKWLSLKNIPSQMFVGFTQQGLFLAGAYIAMGHGMPASIAALVIGLQPIVTAIYMAFIEKQKLRPIQWFGLVMGFFGVFLVLNPMSQHGIHVSLIAISGAILGLFGLTFGTIYQKKVTVDGHVLTHIFYQNIALAVIMGIVSLLFEKQSIVLNFEFIFSLSWLVLVIGMLAIFLLIVMNEHGESTKVATYFYLVPVLTTIESWLLFNKSISHMGLVGMGISVIGLLMVMRK